MLKLIHHSFPIRKVKERIDPEPGEPYGAIWLQNYNNLEKGESIPIQFYDGVSGFQEIWLKLDN